METTACAADPDVIAAAKTVAAETDKMRELQKQEHDAVLADATWQAAKQRFDAAAQAAHATPAVAASPAAPAAP